MEDSTQNIGAVGKTFQNDQYFALRALGLNEQELRLLRRRGRLELDRRWPAHDGHWQLQFRQCGSLRTIELGNDAKLAGRVLHELSMLRSAHCPRRELRCAVQQGRQLLREVKQRLTLMAPELGLRYDGGSLRKSRRRNPALHF